MNTGARLVKDALGLAAVLGLAAGCAGLSFPGPPVAEVGRQRRQRAEQAARRFEATRDRAELQAALACRDYGDVEGCRQRLRRLLERNPNHRDARLLMAELPLSDDRPQAAYSQVEQAPKACPDDAELQYATGLLLDATGQSAGALPYYARAAELEPGNELYAAGYQTAREAIERAEPAWADPPGALSGLRERPLGPALLAPDHSGPSARPLPRPARCGPNRPIATARTADAANRSTGRLSICATETTDRVDPAGYPEAVEARRVGPALGRRGEALAEDPHEKPLARFPGAADAGPNNPQIPIAAATAALRENQPQLAIELLGPALPDSFSASGSRHGRRTRSTRREPGAKGRCPTGAPQAYRVLAVAYYRLGDYRSSQVALQKALSLDNASALSYLLMGCTLAKLGQFESAEAHFRQARAINPRYALGR